MTFTNYLKGQLNDFVDSYKKYFVRTLGTVLTFTVICFVVIAFLLKYSDFAPTREARKQLSMLSYFFIRYSVADIYSLVDLSKTVFVFFVAIFSIGLSRFTMTEMEEKNEFSFGSFLKKLRGNDLLLLLGVFILCCIMDYGLFRADSFLGVSLDNREFEKWTHSLIFQIRIYVPLILFSITVFKLVAGKLPKLNFKKILFLFVSLWLFNEFAYEISLFVRNHIFGLFLVPASEDKKYLYESILGVSLIACYFVGYYSAMTTSLKQLEE